MKGYLEVRVDLDGGVLQGSMDSQPDPQIMTVM